MNISAINTVSDLMRINEEVKSYEDELTLEDRIVETVIQQGWVAGHHVVKRLLTAELKLHISWLEEMMDNNEDGNDKEYKAGVALLSKDVFALKSALAAFDQVDINEEEDEE